MAGEENSEISANLIAEDGTAYTLSDDQVLGRSDQDDITIPNQKISRGHARFRFHEGHLSVEDLDSTNGTRVNMRRIPANASTELRDGDIVSFDTVDLRVEIRGLPDSGTSAGEDAENDATVVGIAPEAEPVDDTDSGEPTAAIRPGSTSVAAPRKDIDLLPASFLESEQALREEKTQWLSPEENRLAMEALEDESIKVDSAGEGPHLIVLFPSGQRATVFLDLEQTREETPDVWEIGRSGPCDIVIDDPDKYISKRHAQLVHMAGKWKLVNLLGANAPYVNGEKILSKFLGNDDKIRLGKTLLVFKSGPPASTAAAGPRASSGKKRGHNPIRLVMTCIGAVLLLIVAWWILG